MNDYIQRPETVPMRKSRTLVDLAAHLLSDLPYAVVEERVVARMATLHQESPPDTDGMVSDKLFEEFEYRYPDPAERRLALSRYLYGGE